MRQNTTLATPRISDSSNSGIKGSASLMQLSAAMNTPMAETMAKMPCRFEGIRMWQSL